VVCGAGILTLLTSTPASAAQPVITVTPNEGLRDGQVVRVEGTGWAPPENDDDGPFGAIMQCPTGTSDPFKCGNGRALTSSDVPDDGRGRLSLDFTVRRSFRTEDDTATVTCGAAPDDCEVQVVEWSKIVEVVLRDREPISFAAPK
jgi:hypothetical protein